MGVYKRKGSSNYYYEFEFKGKTYKGTTGTKLLHEARAFEVTRRKELEADVKEQRAGVQRMDLGTLADLWLASARIAHKDWKNDESRVRKLFGRALVRGIDVPATYTDPQGQQRPRFALSRRLKLHELSQSLLLQLRDARHAEQNSAATINREMALIQSLIGFAPSHNVVTPNPPLVFSSKRNKAGALKLREPEGKLRFLTEAEEVALLAALWQKYENSASKKTGQGNKLILDQIDLCVFLLDTGARYGEVAQTTWDVVDMDRREIDLYRSKGGRSSTLAMTERLFRMLEARKEMTGVRRYIFPAGNGRGWSDDDSPRGHSTSGIQGTMDALGFNTPERVAAIGKATPHTFRDTFASRLIQRGFTLYEVQHLLGHASPAMTQKYAKLQVTVTSARASAVLDGVAGQGYPWKRAPTPALASTAVGPTAITHHKEAA